MDSLLVRGRQIAEKHNRDGDGFKNVGRKNAYECKKCGSYIITIDRDPGVTPFMIKCENCGDMAKSKFYRVQNWLEPTHEWYRPTTLAGVDPKYYDHLGRGGLILRPIGEDKWLRGDELKERPKDHIEEMAALKREFDKVERDRLERKLNLAEAAIMSRQQRRHRERKNYEPPEEITMYGVRYRRVD